MKKTHKWLIIKIVVIVILTCFGLYEVHMAVKEQIKSSESIGEVDLGVIVVKPEKSLEWLKDVNEGNIDKMIDEGK